MRATINAANIGAAATPDSHPDCRTPLIQIVALYLFTARAAGGWSRWQVERGAFIFAQSLALGSHSNLATRHSACTAGRTTKTPDALDPLEWSFVRQAYGVERRIVVYVAQIKKPPLPERRVQEATWVVTLQEADFIRVFVRFKTT